MPTLYRCRTSLAEVARMFDAEPPPHADWSGELWPGRIGLVVRSEGAARRIEAMRWGLPPALGEAAPRRRAPTGVWWRQLLPDRSGLLAPAHRCLIILDSFALPDGVSGARTRTWYGFDDPPIFAWAGLWRTGARVRGYAGMLVDAAAPVRPNRIMPALLDRRDHATWLEADIGEASRQVRSVAWPGLYREPTEQPWGADRTP